MPNAPPITRCCSLTGSHRQHSQACLCVRHCFLSCPGAQCPRGPSGDLWGRSPLSGLSCKLELSCICELMTPSFNCESLRLCLAPRPSGPSWKVSQGHEDHRADLIHSFLAPEGLSDLIVCCPLSLKPLFLIPCLVFTVTSATRVYPTCVIPSRPEADSGVTECMNLFQVMGQ